MVDWGCEQRRKPFDPGQKGVAVSTTVSEVGRAENFIAFSRSGQLWRSIDNGMQRF